LKIKLNSNVKRASKGTWIPSNNK